MRTFKLITLTAATTLMVTSAVLTPTLIGGLAAGFFVLALIVESWINMTGQSDA